MSRRIIIAALSAAALAAVATRAVADKPEPSATASASASAKPEVPKRDLSKKPPPAEDSKIPTPDEWSKGDPVALARPLPNGCDAVLVRAWLRIRCSQFAPAAGMLLSGSRDDVFFYSLRSVSKEHGFPMFTGQGDFVEAIVQLKKGDRRVMQLSKLVLDDYSGFGFGSDGLVMISETWLESDPAPVIVVTKL